MRPFIALISRALALAAFALLAPEAMAQPCGVNATPNNPVAICQGATQQLNAVPTSGQGPYSYSWAPATGLSNASIANPVASPATSTVYTVTMTDANGCTATDQVTVNVNAAPPAQLTSTGPEQVSTFNGLTTFSICDPSGSFPFSFTDQTAGGTMRTINWGDGSPVVNPAQGWSLSHTYNQGLWTMTYTVNYANGCTRTQQYQVFLGTNPGGGISTDPNTNICTGATLPFYINSTAGNSPGTTYIINFGDGNSITLNHPPPAVVNHTYTTSTCGLPGGQLNVTFTAQNPCDQTQGQIGPIRVSETPVAQMAVTPNDTACVNTTVTFTDQSIGLQAPGCNTPPRNIWSIAPAAGWTVVSGNLGNLNGNPTNPTLWTDGSTNLGVQFSVAGTYTIDLLTGNACGTHTLSRTICVEEPPVPSFTLPTPGCAPYQPVNTNASTYGQNCLLTHQWTVNGVASPCGGPSWSFASGNAQSQQPQFLFSEPGTYTVQYRAINSCNVPPVQQVITVNAPPQVTMNALSGICAGQCVNPSATVQPCGAPISTYAWTFPGGSPANANTASPGQVCFANAGSPTLSLTVTNACGSATVNQNLAIGTAPPMPVVASNSPVCAGQTLSLSAALIPGATFQWTNPQGTIIGTSPSVTISNVTAANAGVYSVVAIANGCTGPAATVNVQVIAAPTVTVSPPSTAICNGQSTTLTANGAANYQWFVGATLIGTGPTLTTSPALTTTYTVSGDLGGCPGNATVNVTVYPLPVVNAGPDQVFCDQAIPANLTAAPTPGTWSGPGVTAGGVFTPTPGQLGTVTLTYTHTNANGCTNSDQVDVTVQAVPAYADAGPDVTLCQGVAPVQLQGWSPAGGSWVGAAPGGWFTPSTVGNFTVTYNYGTGTCATSDQAVVNVVPASILQVTPAFSRCADAPPVALIGAPAGGTWSGSGVSGPPWQFDPAAVAPGSTSTLTYTFTNANGCISSATTTATVNALPVVNAGPDVSLCDQPIPFQLGGAPAGGSWSSTGAINVTPGGVITPNGVANDVLTYSFTDANGCSGSDQIAVDIQPVLVPAFAGNDTSVCVGTGALVLSGTPAGGSWSGPQVAPGGSFSTSAAGTYALTYSVGAGTCLLQDQIVITVEALPVVDAGNDISVCLEGGIQVLVASPSGGTWSGAAIDPLTGAFDPLLALPGGNPVTYAYTDPATGCSNSDGAVVTVNPMPVAGFTHAPVACVGAPFQFTNTSSGYSSSQWDFGDGGGSLASSPFHVFAATGAFDVTLVVRTGANCTDTITSTVVVWDVPDAQPVLDAVNGCGPLTVSFDNNSVGDGLSYWWDFGGLGTSGLQWPPAFTFPMDPQDAVSYPVTLTASNACGSDAATVNVTVLPSPTAVFGPNVDEHCAFAPVPFANVSYGLPDSFQWEFGDGATSTSSAAIVTHAYPADTVGTPYTITLIASNQCGSDTAQYTITVLPNQVTSFFNVDPVQGCAPLTVNLTHYTAGDTALAWNLGDGNVSLLPDLAHAYTQPGTYTITLEAFGCGYDSYSQQVTVHPAPSPAFSVSPQGTCVGGAFTFTNTTPGISGSQWTFGDGGTSTLTSPTHSYGASGQFPVTLTVTSALNGCTASLTQLVNVSITPVAAFTPTPDNGCIDLQVAFTNQSTSAGFYQWSFGDGNTSALAEPFHTYTAPGTYTVTLIAENVNGCSDTVSADVVAHPLPDALFTLSAAQSCTAPVTVQTLNASQGAIGFQWDLGNGQGSSLNQPAITFDAPGTYTVTLTATNQYGCTDQHQAQFVVHPTPEAGFIALPQPACAGRPITFQNTSQNATAFRWRFGDGGQSQADAPLHAYAQPGQYTVTLIAYGAGGCTDTLVAANAVTVNPTPMADFTSDTLISVRNALQFSNLSQGAVAYTWDFGDGEGSHDAHPLHLYPADGGGYTVCLVAVNSFSCPDTVCKFQLVNSDPLVFVPNAFTPNNDGRNERFRPIIAGYEGWRYRLIIFDRWGMEVWRTDDREEGWDGRVGGKPPVIDVYVWKVLLERDGDARDFIGHVTLLD
jgi:gliding motility-associated-like protein